jgi:hypothetical protein
LVKGLAWQAIKCEPPSDGRYRAPSWSWASVDGIIAVGVWGKWEPVATVIDCNVEVEGGNPFGRVKNGWIKMEAPLLPLAPVAADFPSPHLSLRTENGNPEGSPASFDTIGRSNDNSSETARSMPLYAVVLGRTFDQDDKGIILNDESTYHCILVSLTESDSRILKRVGTFLMGSDELGEEGLNSLRTVLTLN